MGYPIIRPCLYILHSSSSSSSSLFDDFSLYHRERGDIKGGGNQRPCGAGALAQDLAVAKSPKKSNWYTHTVSTILPYSVCVCVCV